MNIWLVGGEKVIPASVETAIKGDPAGYTVTRINGSDRYETAKLISEAGVKIAGKPSKVFVASGDSFADALAISPIAFAKKYPIVLTQKDSTSDFSKKALGNLGVDTKILVGGKAVVSEGVEKDLTITKRVAGDDRAVTANLVSDWAKDSEGFNKANAALVGGTNGNGADSLVAAPLGGKSLTTLHFAGWPATNVYLKDKSGDLTGKGFVFGGKAAVSDGQVSDAQSAAQSAGAPLSVITSDSAIKVVSSGSTTKANKGAVTYSVKVADSSATVNIGLVAADNLTVIDGKTLFKDGAILGNNTGVSIESVNGATLTPAAGSNASTNTTKTSAKAKDGAITFTVDSENAANVVPVVWIDKSGGINGQLEFATSPSATSPQAPSETFALGSATRWIPEDFAGGNVTGSDQDITFVNKAEKYFTTAAGTYRYDDNDQFYVGNDGIPRSLDYFVARLTVGDDLDAGNAPSPSVYAPTAAQSSKFTLLNTTPGTPSTPAPVTATTSSVTITVAGTTPSVPTTYKVYGAEGSAQTLNVDSSSVLATVTSSSDADSTTPGIQVKLSGLKSGTTYTVGTTQTIDGEESVLSTAADVATTSPAVPLSSGVVVNDAQATGTTGNDKLSAGDTLEFTFDQAVTTESSWSLTLRSGATNVTLDSSNSSVKSLSSGKVLQVKLGDDFPISGNFTLSTALVQVVAAAGIKNDTGVYAPLASDDREVVGAATTLANAPVITTNSGNFVLTFGSGNVTDSASGYAYAKLYDGKTGKYLGKSAEFQGSSRAVSAAQTVTPEASVTAFAGDATHPIKVVVVNLSGTGGSDRGVSAAGVDNS